MRVLGSRYEEAEALDLRARIAFRRGQTAPAKRHWGAALTILDELGSPRAAALRRSLALLDQ